MNLVRNVTVTKETGRSFRDYTNTETVRVELDLAPRATFMCATTATDEMLYGRRGGEEARRMMTEQNGRRIAHSVASQVREEIEQSVMRLLGFLKPGERGSLSRI